MKYARTCMVIVVVVNMAACASKPVEEHYYSLVLSADVPEMPLEDETAASHLIIGPVQLPDYLNSHSLSIAVGSNQIRKANHHFWAEPLDEAIAKVLVRDLASLLEGVQVDRDAGRWTEEGDCHLRLEFDRFHPTDDSRAVSSGRYWVSAPEQDVRREFHLTHTLSDDGYGHAVEVLRQSLGALAAEIAATIEDDSLCSGPEQQESHQ